MISREPDGVANKIKMMRSRYRGAFWVVEGRDDWLLFGKFIRGEKCKIEVAGGKIHVCEAI